MKKIYYFAILLSSLLAFSCQNEEELDAVGYLRMDVETVGMTSPQTRIAADYNPKQLAVQIVNTSGQVVEETANYTEWEGRQLRLKPGNYTIKVASNGFDGSESGFDIPYYTGSTEVTITRGTEVTASVTCTLANVKVTVKYDETFKTAFKTAAATVSSSVATAEPLNFVMNTEFSSAYFPAGNLTVGLTATNNAGVTNEDPKIQTVVDAKARQHYIFNFKTAEVGTQGGVNVTVDGTETIYNFLFDVSTEAKTSLAVKGVNPFAKLAYVSGIITAQEQGTSLDDSKMKFQYKAANASEWSTVDATKDGENYNATLTGLTPATTYECKLVYGEEFASNATSFTTGDALQLYNSGFEYWNQNGKSWYPNESGTSFWDTSNPGSTSIGEKWNVTTQATDVKHGGTSCARLESKYVVLKFAAASLYSGAFGELVGTSGAKLNWGRSFTARPTQFTGWYNYTPAKTNRGTAPSGAPAKGEDDLCSIYLVLTTGVVPVNNTDMDNFPNWNTDPRVVAYGALDDSQCGNTGGWKQFNIDLKYNDLTTQPTHVIVVCSSSKYGDYFYGGEGSLLYLDDFELLYDKEPITK